VVNLISNETSQFQKSDLIDCRDAYTKTLEEMAASDDTTWHLNRRTFCITSSATYRSDRRAVPMA
jgi:hypothetical protein